MGRYVTQRGVEIEMSNDEAARAIGYKPVEGEKKAPAKRQAAKSEDDTK